MKFRNIRRIKTFNIQQGGPNRNLLGKLWKPPRNFVDTLSDGGCVAPVLVDELVYEELEADHGHEAEPHHQADPHHDPQLQGGAHRLLAW